MADFWKDIGDLGHAVVTGRWAGGENSIGDIAQRDPWAIAAPVAAIAAPFAAPAIGGALGIGEAGAAAAGAGAADAGLGFAEGGAAAGGDLSSFLAAPDAALSGGTASDALAFNPTPLAADTGAAPGGASIDQLLTPGGQMGSPLPPQNITPAVTGTPGAAPGAPASSAWDTLTSPSKWTLGGVAQGAGVAAAGAGLAFNMAKKSSVSASQDQMTNNATFAQQQAAALTPEAKQLRSYLENGTLPPSQQAAVDQAVAAEKARLVANAGKQGGSTDPTQNTALSQDLAAADRNGLILAGKLEEQLFTAGQNLLNTGLNALGLSNQLYTSLAQMDRSDTKDMNAAIANFASSLGNSKGPTINIGGASKAA